MKFKTLGIGVVLLVFLSSCYKESVGELFINDLDIVVTSYDKTFDFDPGSQSFVMPDSVLTITEDGTEGNDGDYDDQILDQIRTELISYGYEDVTDSTDNEADLAVLVYVIQIDNYVVGGWPGWGWWGWYPWYPGWGWGPGWGGYYPFPIYVDSYRKGTLLIDILDPNSASPMNENDVPVRWEAALNGLLEGSPASIESRITTGIDQAFSQSPYLSN